LSPFRGGLRQPHPWTGNFFARGVLVQLAVLKKVCGSDTKGRLLAGRRHTFSEERRQGNGLVPQGGPEAGGSRTTCFLSSPTWVTEVPLGFPSHRASGRGPHRGGSGGGRPGARSVGTSMGSYTRPRRLSGTAVGPPSCRRLAPLLQNPHSPISGTPARWCGRWFGLPRVVRLF